MQIKDIFPFISASLMFMFKSLKCSDFICVYTNFSSEVIFYFQQSARPMIR